MISSLKGLAVAALILVSAAGGAWFASRAAPVRSAVALLQESRTALAAGNVSGARRLAREAAAADPASTDADRALALAALAEGDGVSAEAALAKLRDAGTPIAALEHLYAHARLLQDDPSGALRHARGATPANAAYAARIEARALALGDTPADAAAAFDRAARLTPNDPELWADIAAYRLTNGDERSAAVASARAYALAPHALAPLLARAHVVRVQYGLVAALPWFEAALARDPYSYDALIGYAATLGDAGRARAMLAATRRALAVRPGDPQALYLLAVLAARAGDAELARAMLLKSGDAIAGLPGPLLLGATLDLDAGSDQQALAKLRNLIALQPMNLAARQLLAAVLVRTGAAGEALDLLRPAGVRGDADSYTLTLAARAFEATGDRTNAAALLDRAAASGRSAGRAATFEVEDSVEILAAATLRSPTPDLATTAPLVRGQLMAGDASAALARAQQFMRARPGSAAAATMLGDAWMIRDRPREAASAYTRAADGSFGEATMLRFTDALERAGRADDASRVLALFLQQNPANPRALRLAGQRALATGDYPRAIAALEAARRIDGARDAVLLAELATAYANLGKLEAARPLAAQAYALAPLSADSTDSYGEILRRAGAHNAALQLLQKAVVLAPREPAVRWHLAQLYAALGRSREAVFHARAAAAAKTFPERDAAARLAASLG